MKRYHFATRGTGTQMFPFLYFLKKKKNDKQKKQVKQFNTNKTEILATSNQSTRRQCISFFLNIETFYLHFPNFSKKTFYYVLLWSGTSTAQEMSGLQRKYLKDL